MSGGQRRDDISHEPGWEGCYYIISSPALSAWHAVQISAHRMDVIGRKTAGAGAGRHLVDALKHSANLSRISAICTDSHRTFALRPAG